jgi:hypothetical protein
MWLESSQDQPEHPDNEGVQLEALRLFLKADPRGQKLKWVWYGTSLMSLAVETVEASWLPVPTHCADYCSMPQALWRTAAEKREFVGMLQNINLLYLGLTVFILMDRTYMGRFCASRPTMSRYRTSASPVTESALRASQGLNSKRGSRCSVPLAMGW